MCQPNIILCVSVCQWGLVLGTTGRGGWQNTLARGIECSLTKRWRRFTTDSTGTQQTRHSISTFKTCHMVTFLFSIYYVIHVHGIKCWNNYCLKNNISSESPEIEFVWNSELRLVFLFVVVCFYVTRKTYLFLALAIPPSSTISISISIPPWAKIGRRARGEGENCQ